MNHAVNRTAMTEYIKVNFPLTEEDYKTGNGKGMWVLVDHETKKTHDEDAMGGRYYGILDNDSLYYPGLESGTVIPFEMRGQNRPVADFHGFLEQLIKLTPEGKKLLIKSKFIPLRKTNTPNAVNIYIGSILRKSRRTWNTRNGSGSG